MEHSIRLGLNTYSYNFFLMCVSKGKAQLTERVTGALKAMELYQRYFEGHVQAKTLSYYISIYAWSVAAGIKVKEYFRMQNQTYQPTDFSDGYDKVGNAGAILQYKHELQNSVFRAEAPDTVTYNTVIGGYSRVSKKFNKYAPLKAEKVLRDMIHLRNNGNTLIALGHRSYNKLISSWVKTKK